MARPQCKFPYLNLTINIIIKQFKVPGSLFTILHSYLFIILWYELKNINICLKRVCHNIRTNNLCVEFDLYL